MRGKHGIALGVAVALAAVGYAVIFAFRPSVNRRPVPTTYSVAPEGCKALYLVMEELKLPVGRLRKPFTRLRDADAVLMVIDPSRGRSNKREVEKLKDWIKKGNALVLFEGLRGKAPPENGRDSKKGCELSGGKRISRRIIAGFGLRLKRVSDPDGNNAPVAFPGVGSIGALEVTSHARWSKPSKAWKVLAADESGPVAVTRRLGKGRVTAVSDPRLPSNENLGREGNLRFVLAAALYGGRPKKILFDEFHHGYVFADSLPGYFSASVFLWMFVQALVGALLFFYSRRARLAGRFRSLTVPGGRSSLEYVESMANIFESRGASSAALEAILRRFLGRLARRTGIGRRSLEADSTGKIRWNDTGVAEDAARLIGRCRRALAADGSPGEATALARELGTCASNMERVRPTRPRQVS